MAGYTFLTYNSSMNNESIDQINENMPGKSFKK